MSSYVSPYDIKKELLNFLRSQDILTIAARGVTTYSDTGSFSGATTHTLGNNPTLVKNIRSVTVASVAKVYGKDYTLNWDTGVITFVAAQTGSYTISYDAGSTDKIFPDFPQSDLKLKDFPRIGFDIISGDTKEQGLGATMTLSDYIVSVVVYHSDTELLEALMATVRQKIQDNKKNFYYIPFITPTGMGPMLPSLFGQTKIFQRNQDCAVMKVYETV